MLQHTSIGTYLSFKEKTLNQFEPVHRKPIVESLVVKLNKWAGTVKYKSETMNF